MIQTVSTSPLAQNIYLYDNQFCTPSTWCGSFVAPHGSQYCCDNTPQLDFKMTPTALNNPYQFNFLTAPQCNMRLSLPDSPVPAGGPNAALVNYETLDPLPTPAAPGGLQNLTWSAWNPPQAWGQCPGNPLTGDGSIRTQFIGTAGQTILCMNPDGSVGMSSDVPSSITQNCQWQDVQGVFKCCNANPSDPSIPTFCGSSGSGYAPGSTGCLNFMTQMCLNAWSTPPGQACQATPGEQCENIVQQCNAYLTGLEGESIVSPIIEGIITNFLNSREWPDYQSTLPALAQYQQRVGLSGNTQDDSVNPFFTTTIPNMCGSAVAQSQGACDNILNALCYPFTREEVGSDPTLQKLCGCHMASNTPPPPTPASVNPFSWQVNDVTTPNQYPFSYPNGILEQDCDPVCVGNNAILNQNRQCQTNTICIIDQAVVNMMNSTAGGNVGINQFCGSSGSGTSTCYVVGTDLNLINSSAGQASINQYCGSCFVAPDGATNPSETQNVPCFGNGTVPGGGGSGNFITSTWNWIKGNKLLSAGIVMAIIFVIALIVFIVHESRKKNDS